MKVSYDFLMHIYKINSKYFHLFAKTPFENNPYFVLFIEKQKLKMLLLKLTTLNSNS